MNMQLAELVESISDAAHAGWMDAKRALGVTSRKSETGEELMVPYSELSEAAKDLDRGAVRAVLVALEDAGYSVIKLPQLHEGNVT